MSANYLLITEGMDMLRDMLAPYIAMELQSAIGEDWWELGVLNKLYDSQRMGLPLAGNWNTLTDALDPARCFTLFDVHWRNIFSRKLSIDFRNWAKELLNWRNKLAHRGGEDFNTDDTWRALDTMARLCDPIDADTAEGIRTKLRIAMYGAEASTHTTGPTIPLPPPVRAKQRPGILTQIAMKNLPGWRQVIQPHPDVAEGRYKNAEFAANLHDVARGAGSIEYRDPVEFFERTYLTEGLSGLLTQALLRVNGKEGGAPVIQLKTAFGGGKTHSMLALYHLLRGNVSVSRIPSIQPLLERAGLTSLPRANVAVLVGTVLNPTVSKRPPNMPGITINTLWGEMAAQLAESAGNMKLYDYVKEADKQGVPPGSEALKNLFDACGPCVVLMDELVAYARVLIGKNKLPAGTFAAFDSFIQQITEAASASVNSLVVASIPESDIEVGGEDGQKTLRTIEHTFGRMEEIWKPVAASEGYEVVRRRLFLPCHDEASRDAVCNALSELYSQNTNDFPLETKELAYRDQIAACYPIHPEVFERLYVDWATLDNFQRTRGVLRLMAAVIHQLWNAGDGSLLIMPGSIPLDTPTVREELLRYLERDVWNPIVDSEVDGRASQPYREDNNNTRFGMLLAARRVTRTIMLGSAPTSRAQSVRGLTINQVHLGAVQPGESIAVFNDALYKLRDLLSFLYNAGDHYWYDTRPTLLKIARDRARRVSTPDIEMLVEKRLHDTVKKEEPFSNVYVCEASSNNIPDEHSVRLVVLRIDEPYTGSVPAAANNILNMRGDMPRNFRNTLVFVAPAANMVDSIKEAARYHLAWNDILKDKDQLNLDNYQITDAQIKLNESKQAVDSRLSAAYCWLLVPYINREKPSEFIWEQTNISGNEGLVKKAARVLESNAQIYTQFAPILLLRELDQLLWVDKNHVNIKTLWEQFCTYCYLPRLTKYSVLERSIIDGVRNSDDFFALAAGYGNEQYIDLKYNASLMSVDKSTMLVKRDAARAQIEAKKPRPVPSDIVLPPQRSDLETNPLGSIKPVPPVMPPIAQTEPPQPKNKRFYMTARLDNTRTIRDVDSLMKDIISHLQKLEGSEIEILLDVNFNAPEGVPQDTVRTVNENCRTLRVRSFEFED